MPAWLAATLPLAALVAWVLVRRLRGRPVQRFVLNAVLGLVLLAYFAITAGLGIFWVANQELPVFDLHYLFGYLTLALVIAHVWINAPLLARFLRRAAPLRAPDGPGFRPSVAWAGRGLVVVGFGVGTFWCGYSRGASVVTVGTGGAVTPPGVGGGLGLPEQLVVEDGVSTPLARWYHERSSHSRVGLVARATAFDTRQVPSPFESYPSEATVALPQPPTPLALPVDAALDRALEGAAAEARTLTRAELGALLHHTQGITAVDGLPGARLYKRAAASGGALYPTVTHVVVSNVDGLAPGLYHYAPREHLLHLLRGGDVGAELAAFVDEPERIAGAAATLVFSSILYRSSWKYGDRGYRYGALDAGHALANAQVATAALGVTAFTLGRFDDAALADLLRVDAVAQAPMALVAVAGADGKTTRWRFAATDLSDRTVNLPDSVRLIAGRTALRRLAEPRPARWPRVEPPTVPAADVPWPGATPAGASVGDTIARRRSERRFGEAPLSLADLARVVRRALGPSTAEVRSLRAYVFATRVDGLPPGLYEVGAAGLALRRTGSFGASLHAIGLSQEVLERAAAVVAITADLPTLSWPDAARGYRTAGLDAGIAGGRLALAATGFGLGASSVGAFFDDELAALLEVDAAQELPLLLVALGPPGGR